MTEEAYYEPISVRGRNATRVVVALVATSILIAAMIAPWWTRDVSFNFDADENPREIPGVEGFALSYGPFGTPGAGGFSTDASRETAVAVLGIAFLLTAALAQGSLLTRFLNARGIIDADDSLPVRLAIGSFLLGVFTILWAGLFLPLLGNNPGWLYGAELPEALLNAVNTDYTYIESGRYANAGFFLGILGLIAYPAWLWADASQTRTNNMLLANAGTTTPEATA